MVLLASVNGALVVGGLVLLVAELTRRAPAPGIPVRRTLTIASLTTGLGRQIGLAIIVALAMLGLTGWPVAAVAAGFGVVFLPRLTSGRVASQRTAKLEGLEQWIRRLSDVLAASRGLEDALQMSARTAPAAIAPAVTALSRRMGARIDTREALLAFADEIDDPAGDRIVAALLIATGQRGGGVQGVLTALAELLARDVAGRREIEAGRAEHRTTLRWIIGFIVGFTAFAILNKSYSAPYGTFTGELVLAVVVILYALGLTWLYKLGQIPVPGRFLDRAQVPLDDLDALGPQIPIGGGW